MAAFVLYLHEIEAKGSKSYTFDIECQWLAEQLGETELEPADKGGALELLARKTGSDLLIEGKLDVDVVTPCSRCNEPASVSIDHAFTHLLSPKHAGALPDELELTPEDLDRDYYEGDVVELDGLVREQILLEVPMQPVCADGCQDEVVVAMLDRTEKPTDLRLAPLQALKKKLAES